MSSHSPARRLGLVASLAAIATMAFGVAGASAAPVELQWSQVKVYESPQVVPNTNRTWLGYVTRKGTNTPPMGPYANGTASVSGNATGPTVDGDSTSGPTAAYTWTFPATGGSVNANTLAGEFELDGIYQYQSPVPPAGHGFTITIANPKIVLNGDGTGSLVASGTGLPSAASGGTDYSTYTDVAIFSLDLTQATCTLNYNGVTSLSGIVPAVAAQGFFTPSYVVGSGPDRTPNTFGSFTLVGVPCAAKGDTGEAGAAGAAGPQGLQGVQGVAGPQGPAGKDGKDASVKSFKVRRSPFKTRKSIVAKVTKKGKFVGYATVKGRKIKLTYITSSIKGTYKFNPVPRHYKTVSVRLTK